MKNKYIWLLGASHALTDTNQGSLPVILPYLVAAGGISYTGAAGLSFAVAFSSSIIQPLFGIWADKVSLNWLMPAGILLAGLCMSLIGVLHDHYWLMFAVAILCGIGIAAFHPEAARMANQLSGRKKGGGMSIFSVGGNIGFALGPALATPALVYAGVSGTLVLAVPAITMFVLLTINASRMRTAADSSVAEERAAAPAGVAAVNEWGKFCWLTVAIIARSVLFHNFNTFLPMYWVRVLGQSNAATGGILTLMFAIGALSTLAGGQLADRFGANAVTRVGTVLMIPALFLFTRATNPALAMASMIFFACSSFIITTPMVVLGQKYLPGSLGLASGVTLGLGISVGGMVSPLIGRYADANGLLATYRLLAFLPIVAALVTLTLKRPATETSR